MKTEYAYVDDKKINNAYYHTLKEKWYSSYDDPIALLRAESKLKSPWIIEQLKTFKHKTHTILDVGCGAGFVSNALALDNFQVTGIDLSKESLEVAKQKDKTKSVNYIYADAYALPFQDRSFDCVVSTDFLEHVSEPKRVLKEVFRVLKPGGVFFFHTFNKNVISYILSIKFIDWFMKHSAEDLHNYDLFIKPKDLILWMNEIGFEDYVIKGIRPVLNQDFIKLLFTGVMPKTFSFTWSRFIIMTYIGYIHKKADAKH